MLRCFSEHDKTYHLVLRMWLQGREEICTLICTPDWLESARFPFGNTITLDINNMLRAYDRVNGLSTAFFVREEYSILSQMKGNPRY